MTLDLSFANGQSQSPVKVYDLVSAKDRIIEFEDRIGKMKIEADGLNVDSDQTAGRCTEMMAQVKTLLKELDNRRLEIIAKPDHFVRGVNSIVRPFRILLENIEKQILKPKFGQWMHQKELERRKEQKRLEDELKKKQAELDREAEKSGVDKVTLPDMNLPQKKEPVRTETGTASTIMVWKGEIIDPDKVPRKYCSPDQALINQAVKGGIRKIAGVKIHEVAQTRVRIA
jgi:hypothetical protein